MAEIKNNQMKFGDGNVDCGNIKISHHKTIYKSDKDATIMRWLSPLEPDNRHHTVRTNRHEGVGNWLLGTSEFREWRRCEGGADERVLFCSGDPGVGKTHLSSLVIDRLCDEAGEEGSAVAWLYIEYLHQEEQTVANMIGAILKRLVGGREIPEEIGEAFRKGRRPLLADLIRMVRNAMASLPPVFICIDAVDECLPENLPQLLKSLRDIVRESPTTRIFLTGRPPVREAILRYFPGAVVIPISPNKDDVRSYLRMKLDLDEEPEAMDDSLRADIMKNIVDKVSDIFLLVKLKIEAILGEETISGRKDKLKEMARGSGLSDAYTTTLTRLKGQKGNKSILGWKVLMWVLHSERPLRTEELCHALGVKIGSADLDPNNVPASRTVLASCLGLVTIEASSSIVRLVHFTLKEHFLSNPTLFHTPHVTIAEACLTYLNSRSVKNLSPTLCWAPSTMPFLEYASCYWGKHTRVEITENVITLALRLLEKYDEHISAQLLLLHHERDGSLGRYYDEGGPVGFTGLHGASFLGGVEIVSAVLEMKEWDINGADCMGCTALIWAASRGHQEVVKMLLEREEVNPHQPDTKLGNTPLSWAAKNGHEGIVQLFLEREDVNPDQQSTRIAQTPLALAAENGHKGIVKMLLERDDVNPNLANAYCGRTPLALAAESGHEGIVKMLLERDDVNPDQADTYYGKTPRLWAAGKELKRVVGILLGQDDVTPSRNATYGRTPLALAAESGHKGIVKMLLERDDVNPNWADTTYNRTPLSFAAHKGHEGIVKMLLERDDVNPDQADTYYHQTLLSWAADNGHEGIVKVLLERDDVNPNWANHCGLTPLTRAAEKGYEGIVKMLLERGDVNPDQADTYYSKTPLSWAAENGHEGIVKMLLERDDVNSIPEVPYYGRTPLTRAAEKGHVGIVKMLLERDDVNPDQPDTKCSQTFLSWAANNGLERIVKVLLERDDVNPNREDPHYGQTPLTSAAEKGHVGIVEMLLERDDVNPDQPDTGNGLTPLLYAAGCGHEGIVKMLLERDVNPDQPGTRYSGTPLLLAVMQGHEAVVKMLLERDVNPNHKDSYHCRTPLTWAAEKGHEGIVKMLLERDDINPDQPGTEYGQTPLSWAAEGGHEGIVKMLLERDDVNPNERDHHGWTPLQHAQEYRHKEVVKLLLERQDVRTTIVESTS